MIKFQKIWSSPPSPSSASPASYKKKALVRGLPGAEHETMLQTRIEALLLPVPSEEELTEVMEVRLAHRKDGNDIENVPEILPRFCVPYQGYSLNFNP